MVRRRKNRSVEENNEEYLANRLFENNRKCVLPNQEKEINCGDTPNEYDRVMLDRLKVDRAMTYLKYLAVIELQLIITLLLVAYSHAFGDAAVNECDAQEHMCDVNAICIPTYNHEPKGHTYECQCKYGYYGNGLECVDVDECDIETMINCDENAHCINTIGSFECECNDGYYGGGDECTKDINECETGEHNCDTENGVCYNTMGSYKCLCYDGYIGLKGKCVWVTDEWREWLVNKSLPMPTKPLI